mmetsp:Transcript_67938/g.102467  ORF Transcript_67938/g.102467 Transcript_67938/m.102467 type:complete len:277 (-) Transcript_67938:1358-2188(-)
MARAKTTVRPIAKKALVRLERRNMPTKREMKTPLLISKKLHQIGENPSPRNLTTTANGNPTGVSLHPVHMKVDLWGGMELSSPTSRDDNLLHQGVTQTMGITEDHLCKCLQAGAPTATIIVDIIQTVLCVIRPPGWKEHILLLTRPHPTTMATTTNGDTVSTGQEGLQQGTTVLGQPHTEANTHLPRKTHHILPNLMALIPPKERTHHGDHHRRRRRNRQVDNTLRHTEDNTEPPALHLSTTNDPRLVVRRAAIRPNTTRPAVLSAERYLHPLIEV